MDRTALINSVKLKLDEFAPAGAGLPYDEYIGPFLDESARDLLREGPLYLLTPTAIPLVNTAEPPVSTVIYEDDKAFIPVPADYIRLYEIKYPLWKRSVREAISRENDNYKVQENEYLRSGYGRPSVTVMTRPAGGRYFECAKVENPGSGTLTPTALYIKNEKPENLAEQFADTLTWRCTSKVLVTMGNANGAKLALEHAVAALGSLIQ